MNGALKLSETEKKIVQQILQRHLNLASQKVWCFGSRANGTPRPDSDLDLLFDPAISLTIRAKLSEAFEESGLSFEVDLVNRDDLADAYRDRIEADKILFKK